MAKAKKSTLVCRPCGYGVTVSDIGSAVVECYECGFELEPAKTAAKKPAAAKTARKKLRAKAAAKKPAARKAAPKKKQ